MINVIAVGRGAAPEAWRWTAAHQRGRLLQYPMRWYTFISHSGLWQTGWLNLSGGEKAMDDLQPPSRSSRVNHEARAVQLFADIAQQYDIAYFTKQVQNNRIHLGRNVYFQFGDFRVDISSKHIVMEVESGGGVTNLVKYWYCADQNLIQKPMVLLHLFQINSINDYASHVTLWSFINQRMVSDLTGRFTGYSYTYRPQHMLEDLYEALRLFEQLITT
jgi:hypothetical protein